MSRTFQTLVASTGGDDLPARIYLSCMEIMALSSLMSEKHFPPLVEALIELARSAHEEDAPAVCALIEAVNCYKD